MSKNIEFVEANIVIKKENFNEAFQSLKEALINEHSKREGNENKLTWIDINKVSKSENLISLLKVAQWNAELDEDENIDTLNSMIMKLGEEKLIFSTLAIYIENGSELMLFAENGSLEYSKIVYSFNNKKVSIYYEEDMIELSKFLLSKAYFDEIIEPDTAIGRALEYLEIKKK